MNLRLVFQFRHSACDTRPYHRRRFQGKLDNISQYLVSVDTGSCRPLALEKQIVVLIGSKIGGLSSDLVKPS